MNNRLLKQTLTLMLAFAMVFTMIPLLGIGAQEAYAASANGGTVRSNSASDATNAFGSSNVTANYSSGTLTITLKNNIDLKAPVVIRKGSSGDKVVIALSGFTLKGAPGTPGGTAAAAAGQDAIRIIPADFNVEVKGNNSASPGSVIGGKGAMIEREDHYRYGARGGDAISFTADSDKSYWNPNADNAKLQYGLTVTGKAVITGGAGADLSGDDWIYNISNCQTNKYALSDNPQFILTAGTGGNGIGQENAGIPWAKMPLAYSKITVDDSTISGGNGGQIDMGTSGTPVLTHYALMNNSAIRQYMRDLPNASTNYDNFVADRIRLTPGDGGDGIVIGAGRKFLNVKQSGRVNGAMCGTVDYGKSKLVNNTNNSLSLQGAASGSGISVYGDIGLQNKNPDVTESNWLSKSETSGDMGIYIAGKVKGGDSPAADALHEDSGDAGSGIVLDGDDIFQEVQNTYPQGEGAGVWGIVEVARSGSVTGGVSGDAVYGASGRGGNGIEEAYTKSDDGSAGMSNIGTDYYIINGSVAGGGSGDTMNLSGTSGGDGISFGNYRDNVKIYGDGSSSGGNGGAGVDREDEGGDAAGSNAIRFYPEDYAYRDNWVASTISRTAGAAPTKKAVDSTGLSVVASMTSFNDYPTTSTRLSCSVTTPSGYSGAKYITWFAEIKLQSNPAVLCQIEPTGTGSTGFNMLSDADYGYLSYPDGSLKGYNLMLSTSDRITETISHNNSYAEIYCVVQLEDGRWAKSNVMHFTKEGWNGSGGGDDEEADIAAATEVTNLINALPGTVTLDNEPQVNAAREAYDALSDNAKTKILPSVLEKLTAAEAAIADLKSRDVRGIIEAITALEPADSVTGENVDTVKAKTDKIRSNINDLSDSKKEALTAEADAMQKFAATEEKVNELKGITPKHTHLLRHVAAKAATCVATGNIEHYACMTCGKMYANEAGTGNELTDVTTPIDPSGHKYGAWRRVTEPSCTTEGSKERICEHDAAHKDTESIPIDPNAHAWDGGQVTKQPAAGVAGERTYTCTRCGAARTESIAPLPQPYVAPPTSTGNQDLPSILPEIHDLPTIKISKPAAAKRKLTAKWKKPKTKDLKKIQGIEVRVVGPGVDKTVTAGARKTSKKVGGLQSKQKYTVMVRAYRYDGIVKHVSGWKSRKVKVK